MMQDIFVILFSVAGIVGLTILIGYLKNKGLFNKDILDNAVDAVTLARLILEVSPVEDMIKNKANAAFDIADIVSEYIYDSNVGDDIDRQKLSLDAAIEILKTLGVSPTDKEIKLMQQLIFESFKWIENQRKVSS